MNRMKLFSVLFVLCALLAAVVGVSVVSAQDLSGTITFYPQGYYAPDQDADSAVVVEQLMQEYMALNPGVTVELVPQVPTGTDYRA